MHRLYQEQDAKSGRKQERRSVALKLQNLASNPSIASKICPQSWHNITNYFKLLQCWREITNAFADSGLPFPSSFQSSLSQNLHYSGKIPVSLKNQLWKRMSYFFLGIKSWLSYGLEIGAATWRWLCFICPLPSLGAQKKKQKRKDQRYNKQKSKGSGKVGRGKLQSN